MSAGLGPQGGLALSAPIIGFVVANVACFIVSHQVYSDAVILTMTSLFLGVALGAPRWASSVRPGMTSEGRVVRRFPAAIEQAG
jgi:hypothetical protein